MTQNCQTAVILIGLSKRNENKIIVYDFKIMFSTKRYQEKKIVKFFTSIFVELPQTLNQPSLYIIGFLESANRIQQRSADGFAGVLKIGSRAVTA